MRRRAGSRGMTLLEVALAAAVMAGVVAVLLTGWSRMAAASGVAGQYREAAEVLRLKLTEVWGCDDLNAIALQGRFADVEDFQTRLRDASWRIETVSKKTGLSEVKVNISWQSNRGEENVSASTLKFMPRELAGQQ